MTDNLIRLIRASVRPFTLIALTSAFIVAALHGNEFATTTLGPAAMLCLGWYFKERSG